MLHFDRGGELAAVPLTASAAQRKPQLRLKALAEIARHAMPRPSTPQSTTSAAGRATSAARAQDHAPGDGERADRPPRPGQRLDLADRRVHARSARGVRGPALAGDQAAARLLVNSSGAAHARNARRGARRAQAGSASGAALLAAALAHTPRPKRCCAARAREWRASRPALARELLRNFPKGGPARAGASAGRRPAGAGGAPPRGRGRRWARTAAETTRTTSRSSAKRISRPRGRGGRGRSSRASAAYDEDADDDSDDDDVDGPDDERRR